MNFSQIIATDLKTYKSLRVVWYAVFALILIANPKVSLRFMSTVSSTDKDWTVISLLKTSADFLKQKGFSDARLTAELLLAHVLELQRVDLYVNFDRPVSPKELAQFRELFRRRLSGEPVQYILGQEEFFGLKFEVNPSVLIPRPETELLVEQIIDDFSGEAGSILDIGTGSGVIAITLAKLLPQAQLTAVDICSKALEVAQRNAARHGVEARIRFLCLDALQPDFASHFTQLFDVVVSNPPYIPLSEKESVPPDVRNFEPHIALFTDTGFEFYAKIARDAHQLLRSGGKLYFELHADAQARVRALLEEKGFQHLMFKKDYQGFVRLARAERPLSE
jgi:release factor glutamine methyltransferase